MGLGSGLAGLALWSFAGLWQFPDALPDSLTLKTWAKAAPDLTATSLTTLGIALAASLAALALTLAVLEAEARSARPLRWEPLIYLPLILPQIAFLPGLQILALTLGAKLSYRWQDNTQLDFKIEQYEQRAAWTWGAGSPNLPVFRARFIQWGLTHWF